VRYRATSYPDFRHGPSRLAVGLQDYVDLASGFNPRTLQLARRPARASQRWPTPDAQTLVDAGDETTAYRGLQYTLELGRLWHPHGRRVLVRPQGRASANTLRRALSLLMRAGCACPCSVTGYQGGQAQHSGWFLDRTGRSDAHVVG